MKRPWKLQIATREGEVTIWHRVRTFATIEAREAAFIAASESVPRFAAARLFVGNWPEF